MLTKKLCPATKDKNGNPEERVCYDTALKAIRASADCIKKNYKYYQARYCPDCRAWHLTTSGTGRSGVSANLETGAVFAGLDVVDGTKFKDPEFLAERAESLKQEMDWNMKMKHLLGYTLKQQSSSRLIEIARGDELKYLEPNRQIEIKKYIAEKLSYRISADLAEIKNCFGRLKNTTNRERKGVLIIQANDLQKRLSYINKVYPEFRKEFEKELAKYK